MTLVLNTEEVVQALALEDYIDAMEEAFTEMGKGAAISSPRTETWIPLTQDGASKKVETQARKLLRSLPDDADAHSSPEWIRAAKDSDRLNYRLKTIAGGYPKRGVMALKIDSTSDSRPVLNGSKRSVKLPLGGGWRFTGMLLLFDIVSGELLAIFPLGPLQRNRVAATSAVGVRHLSRKNSRTLGIIGSGFQAEGQALAAGIVRKLKRVKVFSPNAAHRKAFAARLEKAMKVEVEPVENGAAACRGSDVVLSATTSMAPVFEFKWLEEGTHLGSINIVEADPKSFRESDRVVVNIRPFGGGSDLVQDYIMGDKKIDTGGGSINKRSAQLRWEKMSDLGELLTGKAKGRTKAEEITFHCNNIGLGIQHAATGARVLANARRLGLGTEIPTDWFLQKEHT
jgi:ornithine cyclodeaminase/alanine dehydrogenase-like protein (mu-crystallin family)